jgi:hypothetical protein
MDLLVEDALLRQLVFKLLLCRDLELCVQPLALLEMVFMMAVSIMSMRIVRVVTVGVVLAVAATASHCLVS